MDQLFYCGCISERCRNISWTFFHVEKSTRAENCQTISRRGPGRSNGVLACSFPGPGAAMPSPKGERTGHRDQIPTAAQREGCGVSRRGRQPCLGHHIEIADFAPGARAAILFRRVVISMPQRLKQLWLRQERDAHSPRAGLAARRLPHSAGGRRREKTSDIPEARMRATPAAIISTSPRGILFQPAFLRETIREVLARIMPDGSVQLRSPRQGPVARHLGTREAHRKIRPGAVVSPRPNPAAGKRRAPLGCSFALLNTPRIYSQ